MTTKKFVREEAMTEADTVLVERDGPVTIVSINRPHCRNAVDGATARKLFDAFLAFDADAEASVAVVSGTGVFFAPAPTSRPWRQAIPTRSASSAAMIPSRRWGPSRLRLTKPVIAAVEGFAVAGGMEAALLGRPARGRRDAIFASSAALLALPLIDLGTIRLPRLIGHSQAIDLILTGRPVGGPEALRMGLANRLVPKGEARAHAIAVARDYRPLPANLPARRPPVGVAAMGSVRGRRHRQRICAAGSR